MKNVDRFDSPDEILLLRIIWNLGYKNNDCFSLGNCKLLLDSFTVVLYICIHVRHFPSQFYLCYCFLYYFSLIEIHDIAIFLRGSVIATVNLVVEQSFLWKLILLKGGQLCPTHVRGMKFARTFTAGVFSNYLDFSLEVLRVGEAVRRSLTALFYNYLSYLLKKTKNGRKGNCVERDIFLYSAIQFIFVAYL